MHGLGQLLHLPVEEARDLPQLRHGRPQLLLRMLRNRAVELSALQTFVIRLRPIDVGRSVLYQKPFVQNVPKVIALLVLVVLPGGRGDGAIGARRIARRSRKALLGPILLRFMYLINMKKSLRSAIRMRLYIMFTHVYLTLHRCRHIDILLLFQEVKEAPDLGLLGQGKEFAALLNGLLDEALSKISFSLNKKQI